MSTNQFYAKSFEEDLALKTLVGKEKKPSQTIQEILKTKVIKPNTKSFGKKKRLACTFLHENYLKTYRPQGLIFQTKQKPDFIFPFDLILLTETNKIFVRYYRIQNELHLHYNHRLIPGFKKFIFKTPPALLKKFPDLKTVWVSVNEFRKENGYKKLPEQKYKLIEYNEVIFHEPVKIIPVAIFGRSKTTKELAKKFNLPHFTSAKKFFEKYELSLRTRRP